LFFALRTLFERSTFLGPSVIYTIIITYVHYLAIPVTVSHQLDDTDRYRSNMATI